MAKDRKEKKTNIGVQNTHDSASYMYITMLNQPFNVCSKTGM